MENIMGSAPRKDANVSSSGACTAQADCISRLQVDAFEPLWYEVCKGSRTRHGSPHTSSMSSSSCSRFRTTPTFLPQPGSNPSCFS